MQKTIQVYTGYPLMTSGLSNSFISHIRCLRTQNNSEDSLLMRSALTEDKVAACWQTTRRRSLRFVPQCAPITQLSRVIRARSPRRTITRRAFTEFTRNSRSCTQTTRSDSALTTFIVSLVAGKQRRSSSGRQIEPDVVISRRPSHGESCCHNAKFVPRNVGELAASAPHAELDLAVFLTPATRHCQPRLRRGGGASARRHDRRRRVIAQIAACRASCSRDAAEASATPPTPRRTARPLHAAHRFLFLLFVVV